MTVQRLLLLALMLSSGTMTLIWIFDEGFSPIKLSGLLGVISVGIIVYFTVTGIKGNARHVHHATGRHRRQGGSGHGGDRIYNRAAFADWQYLHFSSPRLATCGDQNRKRFGSSGHIGLDRRPGKQARHCPPEKRVSRRMNAARDEPLHSTMIRASRDDLA